MQLREVIRRMLCGATKATLSRACYRLLSHTADLRVLGHLFACLLSHAIASFELRYLILADRVPLKTSSKMLLLGIRLWVTNAEEKFLFTFGSNTAVHTKDATQWQSARRATVASTSVCSAPKKIKPKTKVKDLVGAEWSAPSLLR